MLKYICKNCNNLECETSICPVCSSRTQLESSKIFWCDTCNTPVFFDKCPICNNECSYIGTDIRPVFADERLLIELLSNKPFEFSGKSVWNTTGNNYYVDGKKIKFSIKDALERIDKEKFLETFNQYRNDNKKFVEHDLDNSYIKNFIMANKERLSYITNEACTYIRNEAKGYESDAMFVSFSGGKDSTVTSDIVIKALGNERIIHMYGDTTLEYPSTKVYIDRFKESHKNTPLLIAKNKEKNFNELCKVIGPPSRTMRWCCTIFKTGAITRKINSTFKNKTRIISFQGIRRNESISRSKYDRDGSNSKISKQFMVAPLIDWLDFDIWLYLLSNKIDFNDAYRLGFSRVGCWCCPNNSSWSEFLAFLNMHQEYIEFHKVLLDFATKTNKTSPEDYVESGGWKARQGGNGLEFSKNAIIDFKPCVLIENTLNIELTKELDDSFYELFKPFGTLNFNIGNSRLNEVFVLERGTNEPLLKISGRKGQRIIKVSVLKFNTKFKDMRASEVLIKDQVTKYQACIGCLACESNCKFNAINITHDIDTNDVKYKIDENKCVGCLECVKHFDGGCLMKKVLRTKLGDKNG